MFIGWINWVQGQLQLLCYFDRRVGLLSTQSFTFLILITSIQIIKIKQKYLCESI
jgi:hypothetical protein